MGSKIDVLCTDFDKTIVSEDTTIRLIKQIIASSSGDERRKIERLWTGLNSSYNLKIQRIYSAFVKTCYKDRIEALQDLSCKIQSLEIESTKKAFPIFRNVNRQMLYSEGKRVFIPKDVSETFAKLKQEDIDIKIISMNWLRDILNGCLEGLVDDGDVFCNDLIFDEKGIAKRGIDIKICSPRDKLNVMNAFSLRKKVAYAGNGPIDIWCLLDADYGFLIRPSDSIIKLLMHLEIEPQRVNKHKEPGLYWVNSWSDIGNILEL